MNPIDDLENRIRASYRLVHEYEKKRQVTDKPKEKLRCEREVKEQWQIIQGYLDEYLDLCRALQYSIPEDIRQIAARFPKFLAEDLQQAYATLRQVVPESVEALDQLIQTLLELGHFHERLNEWKDAHNLLQECLTALIPLKGELEAALDHPQQWRRTSGLRLWGPCRTRFRQLESFCQDIKFIDSQPFRRTEGRIEGPDWMIAIAISQGNMETCLKENDLENLYEATTALWDECYDALYRADKHLRDAVGELYAFSKIILRSVENDHDHG